MIKRRISDKNRLITVFLWEKFEKLTFFRNFKEISGIIKLIKHERKVLMEITSVNVRKVEKEDSRMKGIATVLVDDCFAIHDIRIIEGDNGLFIAMPSRKSVTGGYRDIAHPTNQETRKLFEDAILKAYNEAE